MSSPSVPPLDTELAEAVLTRFLREEAGRAGFQKLILGLSGGIDSALSALLAARAVGPENVLALALPYRESSAESLTHAAEVAEVAGIRLERVDVTAAADGYLSAIDAGDDLDRHRRGNVLARMRMIALFDRSLADGSLVVGTSNKTELLLGYGTLYGDMASALNPIGDLYKCQVRALARDLGCPDSVLDKSPSADLWAGQTDEDDLGFTYDQADAVLYRLVDLRHSPTRMEADGFDRELVDAIFRRVRQNQFKRRGPLIAKLSARTINWEFRYPRDWGT